jgi:L-lactate dehydrogenase complex protein LldE
MNVQIFVPCFIDQLYPDMAFNMVKVLKKAGCSVHYNTSQTCCGQPAFNAGFHGEAKEVCTKFLQDFEGADYIVAPSASCVGFVKNYYKQVFENSAYKTQAAKTAERIFEFSDFLVNVLKETNFGAVLNEKATYHDSCAALRECKIKN